MANICQYPSDNPLTQHQDCPNPLPNKNLQIMKRCRWNKSRCSYVVRKCISIYRQSFSQMTAMMMVVMMRAQIFFKDMFVFSGTSVWYVFSTMEPNPLHNRYKQNIMIEKMGANFPPNKLSHCLNKWSRNEMEIHIEKNSNKAILDKFWKIFPKLAV